MEMITSVRIDDLSHEKQVMLALFCLKQMYHVDFKVFEKNNETHHVEKSIDLIERWLIGRASEKECDDVVAHLRNANTVKNARVITCIAAIRAVYNTEIAADNVAGVAARVVLYKDGYNTRHDNAKDDIKREQWRRYDELFHMEKYVEDILLNDDSVLRPNRKS